MTSTNQETLDAALSRLHLLVPKPLLSPKVAIVCGSGLSTLGTSIQDRVDIPYSEIPGFLTSKVPGHQSILAFGWIGEDGRRTPVVAMLGRLHIYEGHTAQQVTFPIRLFSRMGCTNIILTNAAGSLNPAIGVATIVVIQDHLSLPSLTGLNPLIGPTFTPSTPRFIPLSDAYSRSLRKLVFHAAAKLNLPYGALSEGVYCWVTGPTFETAAEGTFLRLAGGDVVGASTVPEVAVAKEEGMQILALSLVTNMVVISSADQGVRAEVERELVGERVIAYAVTDTVQNTEIQESHEPTTVVSHDEVLATGLAKAELMKALVVEVVQSLP
ncbi:hypothetical protein FRC14_005849 [Serendipita sp. 396]|nr:hypothetical protein FRC14_005849 [Serendipita sp. 396]